MRLLLAEQIAKIRGERSTVSAVAPVSRTNFTTAQACRRSVYDAGLVSENRSRPYLELIGNLITEIGGTEFRFCRLRPHEFFGCRCSVWPGYFLLWDLFAWRVNHNPKPMYARGCLGNGATNNNRHGVSGPTVSGLPTIRRIVVPPTQVALSKNHGKGDYSYKGAISTST